MSDRVGPSWELFIDESGELEPGGGASQLCGMLVDGNAAIPSSRNLRPALRLAFPSIAYPPHASYLTTVSGYVGCWVRGGEPTDERAPVAIFAECARLLRTAPALAHFDAWRTFATRATKKLAPTDAWKVDGWLGKRAPREHAVASHFVTRRMQVFRDMMTAFGRSRAGRLFVVGSHELEPHPDPSLPDLVRRHRYLVLLVALLERVIALVADEARPATVRFWVGARWLVTETDAQGPFAGSPIELTRVHLDASVEAARSTMGARGTGVLFECFRPEDFNAQVHPGVVVADHASRGLFRLLGSAENFDKVDRYSRSYVGAPCVAPAASIPMAGALPTVAATGKSRDAFLVAWAGTPAPVLGPTRPGWAGDQALTWARALARGTGAPR